MGNELKPLTVADLIAHLQSFPPDLLVTYQCCSEQVLLEADLVTVERFGLPRPDGWVHDARPDKPTQEYVSFPGN